MCAKRRSAKDRSILFSDTFYSDMEMEGMLYAAIVRTPFSQGIIQSIHIPDLPEGYSFFCHSDIPGKKNIRTMGVETPVFCAKNIAYRGEPAGLVTGPDEQKVSELASTAVFTLKQEPKEEAQADEAPEAKKSIAVMPKTEDCNIACERTVRYGTEDDDEFEALFSEAAYVVDGVWNSTLHPLSYGEPTGTFIALKGGNLQVYTATQWLSHLRKTLSEVTGIKDDKISITRTPSSDLHTNVLWQTSLLSSQAAVAALKTGKPVKLVLSREEQELYMDNAAPVSVIYRTAIAKNGELIAVDATIDIDVGCRNPFAKEIVDRIVIASLSIYRARSLRIRAQARNSPQQPFSINLSTIDSQAFFAIENQMQRISEKTGFTPVELRLLNWKEPNVKKKDAYPFLFQCEKVKETLEAVSRASDFLRKYTAYKLDEKDRYSEKKDLASPYTPPLRGIGLACAFHGCGYAGTNFSTKNTMLEATLEKDGSLTIHAMPPNETVWAIWKQMAHETLGIESSKVKLESNFVPGAEPEAPDTITNGIGIYTLLLQKCLKSLKPKLNGELPVTVKKAMNSVSKTHWSKESFTGQPFFKTSFGAAVVELELDPATYREKLRGIWIVVNGGKILDVRAAEGAIKNSVQQVLASFIEDDPIAYTNIKLQFVLSNQDASPVGDIMPSVIPAAFSAALSQALAATITCLPIKTDTMYVISSQAQRALDEILAMQKEELARKQAEQEAEAMAALEAETLAALGEQKPEKAPAEQPDAQEDDMQSHKTEETEELEELESMETDVQEKTMENDE
ncbi:MAG: xanthine dehydrogenase family protein molybdopterin-binding subunit [Treponema sp.]|nr:xanthine dehydrogenase family protein molybdopterin-binding subunit [Treponema sp.]